MTAVEVYRGVILNRIDPTWADQQHLNSLLSILTAVSETEEDRKPKKMSINEIQKVIAE